MNVHADPKAANSSQIAVRRTAAPKALDKGALPPHTARSAAQVRRCVNA